MPKASRRPQTQLRRFRWTGGVLATPENDSIKNSGDDLFAGSLVLIDMIGKKQRLQNRLHGASRPAYR
jgi:hypothetical protein